MAIISPLDGFGYTDIKRSFWSLILALPSIVTDKFKALNAEKLIDLKADEVYIKIKEELKLIN